MCKENTLTLFHSFQRVFVTALFIRSIEHTLENAALLTMQLCRTAVYFQFQLDGRVCAAFTRVSLKEQTIEGLRKYLGILATLGCAIVDEKHRHSETVKAGAGNKGKWILALEVNYGCIGQTTTKK